MLESLIKQITLLFQERAARLETLQHESQRIQSRHLKAVTHLEADVVKTKEALETEYMKKTSFYQQEIDELQDKLEKVEVALAQSKEQRERL